MGKLLPKGVTSTAQGRFQSRIYRNGSSVHLGVFDDVNEAAAAYRVAFIARKTSIANPPATAIRSLPTTELSIAPGPAKPIQLATASPPEMPQVEPQPVPVTVPDRPKVIPPGCCPNCASPLYGVVGSSDDAKKCRQCGYQTPRAKTDANGNRMFNSSGEEEAFSAAGISRRQLEDEHWMATNKGRGVIGHL